MTSLILLAVLQSVISVEAGLVNHAQGEVNVRVNENVPEGAMIRTGASGYVEVLLNPGSFLRLGENSEAIIEETELTDIRLRVVSGVAVLEASEILDEFPITLISGNLQTSVVEAGIYKFEDGRATVLRGRLDLPDAGIAYEEGWSVYFDRLYRATRVTNEPATNVERWSAARASVLAQANAHAYQGLLARGGIFYPTSRPGYWMSNLNSWTYFPNTRYQSPYGYRYYSTIDVDRSLASGPFNGGGSSRTGTGSETSGPRPSFPSAGASRGGGGGVPRPPAPTFGTVVPAKNGPGTQQGN